MEININLDDLELPAHRRKSQRAKPAVNKPQKRKRRKRKQAQPAAPNSTSPARQAPIVVNAPVNIDELCPHCGRGFYWRMEGSDHWTCFFCRLPPYGRADHAYIAAADPDCERLMNDYRAYVACRSAVEPAVVQESTAAEPVTPPAAEPPLCP